MKIINIKLMDPRAILPVQRSGDAGADLYALCETTVSTLPVRINLGLAVEIPEGYVGFVVGRSSGSLRGEIVIQGTIDHSYRGELSIVAYSIRSSWHIKRGDRIAQLVILPCPRVEYVACSELSSTTRGAQGFGSTGVGGVHSWDANGSPVRRPGNGG